MEIWKDISGYEGLYQVSNLGKICNSNSGKILGLRKNGRGYVIYFLSKGGEQLNSLCHRLVAQAFITNPENKRTVNHINGIKTDNRVENLEWATHSENCKHAFATGLNKVSDKNSFKINHPTKGRFGEQHKSAKPILQFSKEGAFIMKWGSIIDAKKDLGIHNAHIGKCCQGILKTAGGFKWKYLQ